MNNEQNGIDMDKWDYFAREGILAMATPEMKLSIDDIHVLVIKIYRGTV